MVHRICGILAGVLFSLLVVEPAAAAKVGGEFLVSTTALNSSIASLPGGAFVVVWRGDAPKFPILGQRYSASASKVRSVFTISASSHERAAPCVAAVPGVGFVVVWDSPDGNGLGTFVQLYTGAGPTGARVRANTFSAGDQYGPTAAGLNNGSFVVAWTSNGQGGSPSAIYGQRFTKAGAKAGREFRLDTSLVGAFHQNPSLSRLSDGGFVLAYRGFNGTYARRFNLNGTGIGGDFQVNPGNEGLQQHPVVAGLTIGGFVVVREVETANAVDIYGQRYNKTGGPIGGSFRINTVVAGKQFDPAIAPLSNGGFAVVWSSGTVSHLAKGRLYRPTGAAAAVEFQVNKSTIPIDASPAVSALANGAFVATWQATYKSAAFVVRGQRFDGK